MGENADVGSMQDILDCNRIFNELGARKDLSLLVDVSPKLHAEQEVVMMLEKEGERLRAKMYVFSEHLVIALYPAAQQITKKTFDSVSGDLVWFGTGKKRRSSIMSGVDVSDADLPAGKKNNEVSNSPNGKNDAENDEAVDRHAVAEHVQLVLKLFIDLNKVTLKITASHSGADIAISLTYCDETAQRVVADYFEFFLENTAAAKKALAALQEMARKAEIKQMRDKLLFLEEQSKKSNESNSMHSSELTPAVSMDEGAEPPPQESDDTVAHDDAQSEAGHISEGSGTKSSRSIGKATGAVIIEETDGFGDDHDEIIYGDDIEADYLVIFYHKKLGFNLTSSPKVGPVVHELVPKQMAAVSGVEAGDRIVAVNAKEVPVTWTHPQLYGLIQEELNRELPIAIKFVRKKLNDNDRVAKVKEAKEFLKKVDVEEDAANTKTVEEETRKSSELTSEAEVELVKKNTDEFTLRKRKSNLPRWKERFNLWKSIKHIVVINDEMNNEQLVNKDRLYERFENVPNLFDTMIGYTEDKSERTCLYALKEIYDTEYKYATDLGLIRECYNKFKATYKRLPCCEANINAPFCRHGAPKKDCQKPSSSILKPIDANILGEIFLNATPLMKINFHLFRQLQVKLNRLYERRLLKQRKVKISEVLGVFCECFVEIAPFLQIYWLYCQRYRNACYQYKKLRAENIDFKKAAMKLEEKHKMSLSILLSKPVQRFTKYHLLFSTLLKYVDKYKMHMFENSSDSGASDVDQRKESVRFERIVRDLNKACETLRKISARVNEQVGDADNLEMMVAVTVEIGGEDGVPELLTGSRRFDSIHTVAFEFVTGKRTEPEGRLYLFNDMLAIAVGKSKETGNVGRIAAVTKKVARLREYAWEKVASSQSKKSNKVLSAIEAGHSVEVVNKTKKGSVRNTHRRGPSSRASDPHSQSGASPSPGGKSTDSNGSPELEKMSVISKDSRDEVFVVPTYFLYEDVIKVENVQRELRDKIIYGVQMRYLPPASRKVKDPKAGPSIVEEELNLFFAEEDRRDEIALKIGLLRQQDQDKRDEFKKNVNKQLARQEQEAKKSI